MLWLVAHSDAKERRCDAAKRTLLTAAQLVGMARCHLQDAPVAMHNEMESAAAAQRRALKAVTRCYGEAFTGEAWDDSAGRIEF